MRYSCFGTVNKTDNILYHSAFGRSKSNAKKTKSRVTLADRLRQWEETAKMEQFKNAIASRY